MSRGPTTAARVRDFLRFLGREARGPGRVYLTGGASAALVGWREMTVDVKIELDPEPPGAFAAIARAREALNLNVELAAPDQFIPELPGWRERSRFIERRRSVDFLHYDFHAQALAKIERSHAQDLRDVEAMHRLGLITPARLTDLFAAVEPLLERYPAIDAPTLRARVETVVATLEASGK